MVTGLPLVTPELNRRSDVPLWTQLYLALRDMIMQRRLSPGFQLPSTRQFARDLNVARNTVVMAYEQLDSDGYVRTRPGARSVVADLPVQGPEPARPVPAPSITSSLSRGGHLMVDKHINRYHSHDSGLRPSTPDLECFPFDIWRRLLARHFRHGSTDLFSYNHLAGYPPLRSAIAKYLHASRGVDCDETQIFITNGTQAALDLLARFLLNPGDCVWMEEPGYRGAQGAFIAAGARLAPLRVEAGSWQLDDLPDRPFQLIYATPSCHQPSAATMRLEQRLDLLAIARARNVWIIEDDFDSEFHISGSSVPAIQGIDRSGLSIYVGTFSKTLFPSLRIGFIVLPKTIKAEFEQAIFVSGHFPSLPIQAALAEFIETGNFARHLRRVRRIYSERRVRFLAMLHEHLGPHLDPLPARVGMQIACRLKGRCDDITIAQHPDARSLNLSPLSTHFQHGATMQGFLLGYTAHEPRHAGKLLQQLQDVLEKASCLNGRAAGG